MTATGKRTVASAAHAGAGQATVIFAAAGSGLDRKAIRKFAEMLSVDIAGGRPFTCLVTRDRVLQQLNRDFLGNDYPTDVLSFPSGAKC